MNISIDDLAALKRRYNLAIKYNKEIFEFKGQELLMGYAKYVIEYLEGVKAERKKA